MILTVDLGTTLTKVALWDHDGLVGQAGVPVGIVHPAPGWSEQDPSEWWTSVVTGCARLREGVGSRFGPVEAVGCTGARQTFVAVDAAGRQVSPAIVWSDRRAGTEAGTLVRQLGGAEQAFDRTGVPLDAGSVAAKVAWLAAHDDEGLAASTWLLAPRDLVVWRLTGEVATDATMASRTGLYDLDGLVVDELAGEAADKLAPIIPPDRVSGRLVPSAAAALGLEAGTPVVIGAGDRPCEVLGTGADEVVPMVSWGTTANVSLPLDDRPAVRPPGMVLSRGARGGWLVEGGLSAAGSFMAWLGELTGHPPAELAELARRSPPGARGVVAAPWLDGARAPWWQPDAGAAFVGLASGHGLPDLARAVFESVAWEVRRCLEGVDAGRIREIDGPAREPDRAGESDATVGVTGSGGSSVAGLALGGAGSAVPAWAETLTGITGLPATRRCSGQAASAGAALLAASAVGADFHLETMDPVEERIEPEPSTVAAYAARSGQAERVAAAIVDLARSNRDVAPAPTAPEGSACG